MIPAALLDLSNAIIGKKMIYRRAYKKTEKVLLMMSYFGLRQWSFKNENIQSLLEKTKNFKFINGDLDFDFKNIDWQEFFKNYIPGIKKHHFKENCDDVEQQRISYNRLKKLHNFLKYLTYFFISGKIFLVLKFIITRITYLLINT